MENLELRSDLHLEVDEATFIATEIEIDNQSIISEMQALGMNTEGVDPEKAARAVWEWIRKKVDEWRS